MHKGSEADHPAGPLLRAGNLAAGRARTVRVRVPVRRNARKRARARITFTAYRHRSCQAQRPGEREGALGARRRPWQGVAFAQAGGLGESNVCSVP